MDKLSRVQDTPMGFNITEYELLDKALECAFMKLTYMKQNLSSFGVASKE